MCQARQIATSQASTENIILLRHYIKIKFLSHPCTMGIFAAEKRINKEHPIKDVLVLKWPTPNFNLKILFSKKFSDFLKNVTKYAKLKVRLVKVVSDF